eukprot:Seg194.3_Seg194.2 transcript_id=Seg194.3_Seg194.2/GoldUCD/mRNA.D3Y31 product="Coagulation factor VIII" protein_id=Seg194.3_Seg194.2/GoldUCD/D3Y31
MQAREQFATWSLNFKILKKPVCSQALGMERKIIADSQITQSSVYHVTTHEGYQARLNNNQCWCSANLRQSDQWVKVDLRHPMSITGIATQGDPNHPSNFVTKFKLRYSVDGSNYFYKIDNLYHEKVLDGANAQNQKKDNLFLSKPFAARYVEFRPTEKNGGGGDTCARFELYGCSYVCDQGFGIESGGTLPTGLTITASHFQSHKPASHARLNGASSWCSTSPNANYYLQFDFGRIVTITGVATQGNPDAEDWVKEFYLDYGSTIGSLAHYQENGATKVLIGNKDRSTIVVNWFRVRLAARYVRIKPKTWQKWICMRVEIIGCDSEFINELGAENRVLEDRRFAAFTFSRWNGHDYRAENGRLNNVRPWGRTKRDPNLMWFKIDLGRVMLVNGIATQGDGTYASNYFPDYKLQYSLDANGLTVVYVKQEGSSSVKVFAGNTNNAGVKFNFLKDSQISTRYVQFLKNSNLANDYTLRVEIYGRPQVCANSFGMVAGEVATYKPTIAVSSGTVSDAKINSAVAWCAATLTVNEYFQYDFGVEKTISGIAIQGKPDADEWVENFKIKYGTQTSSLTTYKEGSSEKTFVGSKSRDLIVYSWFATNLKTRYLRIVPTAWKTKICLRVNVYGCPSSGCFDDFDIALAATVPDSDLTSSTAVSGNEAKNGRFNSGGTWEASGGNKPWIQVCLSNIRTISSVIIQGPGDKDNIAKVTGFSLQYLYSTSGTVHVYRYGGALKIFAGVKGRYESVQVDLPVAVVAKCLRLQVETKSSNSFNPGLRWELLGCATVSKVSSVSVSQTFVTTAIEGKLQVTCTVSGQPGVTINWMKSTAVIQSSGSYVVGANTISNSDINGQSTKTLEITANGEFIASTFSTCVVTHAGAGLVRCQQDYTCSASYGSMASSINTASTKFEVTALRAKPAAPTGITSSGITRTEITVSWSAALAGDFQVQDYRAAIKRKGTSSEIASKTEDGIAGTTKTFSGLDVFTEYTIMISARCKTVLVYSAPGTFDVRTGEGVASAPATPTAVSETSRSIKVTWNEPSPLNGILHSYQIKLKKSGASFSSPIPVDKSTREKIVDSLDPYTSYELQVSATTKGGAIQGAWSPSATIRTKEDYPSQPLELEENDVQARYSIIKWGKPAKENGIVRNYTLNFMGRKSYNSTFMHDNITMLSANVLQYNMTDLVPGTNYTVKVAASTGVGRGNYSKPIVIHTFYTDPPKPSMNAAVKGVDNTEVTLKSASDINGPISKYELTVVNGHTQCLSQPTGIPVTVPSVPITLTFEAGIKAVKGVSLDIETVGNFTLCYRAVINNKNISYFSKFTSTHLERKTLENVNSTLFGTESGATQLVIPLVRGPAGSKFYHIVVLEHTASSTNLKNPSLYALNELGEYKAATYKPGTPYITAEIASFVSKFSIGDGKSYSRSSRKRRNTEGIKYTNVALKPNTQYSVFQRAFISDTVFYSSTWMGPLRTGPATTIYQLTGPATTTPGSSGNGVDSKDNGNIGFISGLIIQFVIIIVLASIIILLLRRRNVKKPSDSTSDKKIEGSTLQNSAFVDGNEHQMHYMELQRRDMQQENTEYATLQPQYENFEGGNTRNNVPQSSRPIRSQVLGNSSAEAAIDPQYATIDEVEA